MRIILSSISFSLVFALAFYYVWPLFGLSPRSYTYNETYTIIVITYTYSYWLGTKKWD